ncbi:MAG: AAA family ATPase [Acholeplasmataceae bacterium]|nr:AAA family ATPase [Acholeplasmataceae bacterium]
MKRALYFFKQTIQKNRLSHLYLISGPKGSGKSQLVDEVAFLILSQKREDVSHLKQQIVERKISNMMVIEPDGLTIKKEQILELQKEFSKTALVSGPRIYVIKSIEKIGTGAANSLLKFMEEPLSHNVYGFLLTDNYEDVIRTIISRSQVLHLKSIDEKDLELELIEQGIDEKIAVLVPYLTKNIDEAILFAENPNFIEMVNFIESLVTNWSNKDISFPLYFAQKGRFLIQDRDFFMNFLELILLYFLDLIHYKAHQEITYQFLREQIQLQSDLLQIKDINAFIEKIQSILERQSYYINLELALDQLSYTLEKMR